ncbi:MAG: hypothetical protein K6F87_05630 [Lachnospiraceae bacterium]|nr:hypothetical protein [Lachnospiraceae bacterium]
MIIGIMENTVVNVVIRIGRILDLPEWNSDNHPNIYPYKPFSSCFHTRG